MNSNGLLDQMGIVGTAIKKIREGWKQFDQAKRRLILILGVTGLVLALGLTIMINTPHYAVLYTNLSAADAGEILQQLDKSGIDAKAEGADTILVPASQVDAVRMDLAASGYPKNASNLDILEQSTGFGITDEDKQVYRRYQLQQDLQAAIETFDSVLEASVSLNIPEKSNFVIEDQRQDASAAILLSLKIGTQLSAENVLAIESLVEKSVPGLTRENISIIDSNMNVLNSQSQNGQMTSTDQLSLQSEIENKLKNQVLALLQPVFGTGRVLAEISVDLNFDDSTVESITFEPAAGNTEGIISSIDKLKESSSGSTGSPQSAGSDSNGGSVTTYEATNTDQSDYEKTSESISYEINTIKETLVRAKGTVNALTVSVILDSTDENAAAYAANVKKLVATAIGVSEDYITVDSLPFLGAASVDETWVTYQETNAKAQQWEQTRFFILLGAAMLLALILLVVIVKLARQSREASLTTVQNQSTAMSGRSRSELTAAYEKTSIDDGDATTLEDDDIATALINNANEIQRRKIESYFDRNPEVATSILRGWLNEDAR